MPELISRTGRVQSWMDDPSGRLPVSCTVFVVMTEWKDPEGIEASGDSPVTPSEMEQVVQSTSATSDPKDTIMAKGLLPLGLCHSGKIYSTLNEILRRGGRYKNGAIVLHLDANHITDLEEFVDAPRDQLPWVKRCVDVTPEWWSELTS